jgi:signal transduction histidine kinase/DNA-binding NarL/FixJ family response regulator
MGDKLGESALRIVLIADEEDEGLRCRRTFRECGYPCAVSCFPPGAALEAMPGSEAAPPLAAAVRKCDAVLIDLEHVSLEAAPRLIDALGGLGAPVVGLLPPDNCDLIYASLEAGLDGYVVKGADRDCLRLVPAVLMWAIDRHRDAQARDRVVDALRHKERQWSAMLNACLSLITYHDAEGRIIWSNAGETDEDNRRIDPLFGTLDGEIWRPEEPASGACPVPSALRTGAPHEGVVVGLDGSRMLQRAFPVVGDDGRTVGAIASTVDTSALAPTEEAIKVAVRAQASVTVAGGIAHKLNDLMAGVAANVNLVLQEVGERPDLAPLLGEIETAALSAGRLSDHLLASARGEKHAPKILDLNDVVEEAVQIQARGCPGAIRIETRLDRSLRRIEANPAQMSLLAAQLLANAVEAIRGEGRVLVATGNETIAADAGGSRSWLEAGRYAMLEISDGGCGISPEIRARMFEPFFSTKGRGRGLGLAGALGVVRGHGGHINVESAPGAGTRVTVYLPTADEGEAPRDRIASDPPKPTAAAPAGQGEVVLVVDDEDIVRHAVSRYLTRLGYLVLKAADGDEALRICAGFEDKIHLALLDMIMPGRDGMEVFRALRESRPGMAIVVMSGYDRGTFERALLESGASAFLQKPVPMDALAAAVRSALDMRAAGLAGGKAVE